VYFIQQLIRDMYDNSAGAVELEGRLPDSLGQLTMLSSFSIRSNKFRGTIPPSMFLIPNITDLFVNVHTKCLALLSRPTDREL
jgi:hypothetical protein